MNFGLDFDELSLRQKKQVYSQARKTANRRIRRLRENSFDVPSETDDYLTEVGRRFFPSFSDKEDREFKVDYAWNMVQNFLNSDSSTLTGIKKIMNDVRERVEGRLNEFRESSDQVSLKGINDVDFYNFLHSKQFRQLRKIIDSDILLEDFNEASNEGVDFDTILDEYEDFLNEEISFNEMQQRRNYALDRIKRRKGKNK